GRHDLRAPAGVRACRALDLEHELFAGQGGDEEAGSGLRGRTSGPFRGTAQGRVRRRRRLTSALATRCASAQIVSVGLTGVEEQNRPPSTQWRLRHACSRPDGLQTEESGSLPMRKPERMCWVFGTGEAGENGPAAAPLKPGTCASTAPVTSGTPPWPEPVDAGAFFGAKATASAPAAAKMSASRGP